MKKLLLILLIVNCSLPIVKTQWVQQTVPVSKPITGIKFIDANTGWALSSSTSSLDTCYILSTSNGGSNWVVQYTNYNSMYLGLSVVDANTIYAGGLITGATANLTKTTNGGLNWTVIPTPTNMSILDMQFLNKDSGWTVGGSVGADVRTTTNGGLNWIVRTNGILQQTQKIFFLNYNTGYCGANTQLYKTTDAGMNWTLQSNFSNSIHSINFKNNLTGWLGLSADVSAKIAYTVNGGLNWTIQSLQPFITVIRSVYFFGDSLGWAGISANIIYKTVNGGNSWGYQGNNSQSISMSFIDSSLGWSGYSGISKTTNGGGVITYVGIININNNIPNKYKLYQNYPNPFNSQTNIRFSLTMSCYVEIKVFDITGKEMTLWRSGTELEAGTHEFQFDANTLSSGVYFYNITVSDTKNKIRFKETKKMILIK